MTTTYKENSQKWKNKTYFMFSMLTSITGTIMLLIYAFTGNQTLYLSLAVSVTGITMLLHWNTISFVWECENCSAIFKITLAQNIAGVNGGINLKKLSCPGCKESGWCRAIVSHENT